MFESNPRLAELTRWKLRRRRPAPDNRITASAISATTRPWCSRRPVGPPCERVPPSLSTSAGLVIDNCTAGRIPAISPLPSDAASRKSRTKGSTWMPSARGSAPGARLRSAIVPPQAMKRPTTPASTARTRFSVSAWRTSRDVLAPSAVRSENSWRRAEARARMRLATLAQAISNTNPTEPNSSQSARSVVGPITRSVSGSVVTPSAAFVLGYCARRRAAMPSSSARADENDADADSRPSTTSASTPRLRSFSHCGPAKSSGCHTCTSDVGSSNSGGITPITSKFVSLN